MRLAPARPEILAEWGKTLPVGCLADRDEAILELSSGRRVLHLGAADAPFHEEKARAGELLHQKLSRVAGEVVGLDLDASAISWLRENEGIVNIHYGDVMASPETHTWLGEPFEMVLCCDVIEHVANPGLLLEACGKYLHPGGVLVVTTVNSTGLKPAVRALLGREAVHPEHVAYYSFSTLGVLLLRSGFTPLDAGMFCYPARSRLLGVLFEGLARWRPGVADGLIMTASQQYK